MAYRIGIDTGGTFTDVVAIEGVAQLRGTSHRIMPDRIETGTFLAAAAATVVRILITAGDFGLDVSIVNTVRPGVIG